MSLYLSICIPTNGRIEILKKTLDSIYANFEVSYSEFEVVLSDNSLDNELLDLLNCTYSKTQVGMFVWASIPTNYPDGFALSDKVLYDANVFITPGGIFGTGGNGFIRISLCAPVELFELAIERVKNAGIAV